MSIATLLARLAEQAMAHSTRVAIELIREARRGETFGDHDQDDGGPREHERETRQILLNVSALAQRTEALAQRAERIDNRMTGALAELQHRAQVPREIGNLLLLWQSDKGPRCISHSVRFTPAALQGGSCTVEPRLLWPVEPGAWLVAINCTIQSVHVGQQNIDLGPAPRGAVVVLNEGVPLGTLLSIEAQPMR